jgi:acetyltransferase-like isoleucine patch superfamily enzyme
MKAKIFTKALLFYIYNSFVTNIPVYCIRHFYLKNLLKFKIGEGTAIHMGCFFTGKNITIGNNTVVNRNCYVDGRSSIQIGDNVSVSPETYILSLDHDSQSSKFETINKQTVIGNNVWIGVRAIILPGVVLNEGSIVGAGSIVTRSTEKFDIVAGNPAKKINSRNCKIDYTLKYFPLFNTDELL